MATKEITRNENFENSSKKDLLHKRLCTAAQFLLNCFKYMHHSEITKSICFALEDVGTFVLEMDSTSQVEAFSNVSSITMDDFGFLKKKASTRLDFNIVTRDEMLLLFVVHNLSLNGKSHFEEVVRGLRNRAPPVISMILSCASVPEKVGYLRKYPQYFRLDDTGHLELTSTINLTFKDSAENSGSSSKDNGCFQLERKTSGDIDTVEVEVNQSIKNASVENKLSFSEVNTTFSGFNCIGVEANCIAQKERCVSPTISAVLSKKEFISNRIRYSVLYLQKIFKLKATQKFMRVILRVLEDVEIYFSYSSCVDKVDLIQNSFVSSILKDSQPVIPSYNSSAEIMSFLNRQEQEQLYFFYSIIFGDQLHYSELFDAFSAHNKSMPIVITSNSEKLSYFKKFNHLFFIDRYGIVQPCTLPDLHLHTSFTLYIFKSYDTLTSISNGMKTTKEILQSQYEDIWFKDNLIYKRLCSLVYFLLHSFGTQPCDCLMKCISYVFPDIGIFLAELSMGEQQELFSSILCTVLKSDTYLRLTAVYEFDTTYASKFKLCVIHIVSNLAFSGETYGMKLVNDFYESVPKELTLLPNFCSAKDPKWCKYLNRCKLWECDSGHYLTLPSSFYFSVDNLDVLSQTRDNTSSNEDPLLISEFCVSQEELKALGLPQDILDILAERMADGIMYLLNFFELNVHSGFLEVVLHIIKRGSVFFKLPPSHQEEVIKKCFRAFRIDEQGNVTCIHTKEMQTCILSVAKRLALCMAYIISKEVSMHYREAFEYYQIFVGWTEIKYVESQLKYFKNRPYIFLICDSGFVSLVNITTIKLDYISVIMPGKLCDSNSLDTYEEENEVTCSDYIPRVQTEVDSFFVDNFQKSALLSCITEVPSNKHESKESQSNFQSEISGMKSFVSSNNYDVSQISCAEKGNKEVVTSQATEDDNISVFKFGASNKALFCPDKISNLGKKSFTFKVKDITTLSTKSLDNSNQTNLNTNRNSNLDNLKNTKKDTIGDNIAPKEIPRTEIQMYSNEDVKDSGDCNSSLLGNPSGKDVSSEKNASVIRNVVHQNTVLPTSLQTIDKMCTIIREGNVWLFEYFKCPLDFRLVCVILHALHEAQRLFLVLTQSEQIALVEKILASEVEDDSCSFKLSSPETFELNKKQRDLLFISYVVGQSGKLHFSTLIEMFEKHKMDISVLMESDYYFEPRSPFFSIDNVRCITLENFPPAKWMTERLSFVPLVSPDLSGLSISQSKIPLIANNEAMFWGNLLDGHSEVPKAVPTNIEGIEKGVRLNDVKGQTKEIKTDNVLKYSQGTLNVLSDRMYDGVSYLLRFFELNIYSDLQHIFDTLLHVVQKCSIFFKLPPTQQEEVIIASFCALRMDEQGQITFAFAKKKIVKLNMVVRMSLCMSFVLRQRGPMHYREIFKYYHKCVGQTKIMLDKDQFDFFNNRKNIFLVCDSGYVSLVKIPSIELDYLSILMSKNLCFPNTLVATYVIKNETNDSDYFTRVQTDVDSSYADSCQKYSKPHVHNKLLSIATKVPCVITDNGEAVFSNFTKKDNIATLDFDMSRESFSSSSPNLTSDIELSHSKNTRTNASINELAIKNGSDDATNGVSPQDVWGIDDLTYGKLCVSVSFLLRTFGPLNCRHLTECISHVLHEIGLILNALSEERRQEVFSSFSSTVLEDGCLRLTTSHELDIKYVSKTKLRILFITSYLALNGKSHYMILLEKLYQLAPEVTIPSFTDASNAKWHGYFKSSKYFKMISRCYLTLPSSFYETACDDQVPLCQSQSQSENNPLTTVIPLGIDKEFKTSTIDLTIGNISQQAEESTVEKHESNALNSKFLVLKSDLPSKLGSSIIETPSKIQEYKEALIPKYTKKENISTFNFGVSTEILPITVPDLKENLDVASHYTLGMPSTCVSLNPNRVESDCKEATSTSIISNLGDNVDIAEHYILETLSTCASSNLIRAESGFKGTTNTSSEPQDVYRKDELMFKKLCASVSFLLHSFGPLHYRQLSDCVSHILIDVRMFLDSLSEKNQLEVFSNIPLTVLHDNYVRSMTSYELDTTYLSKNKLRLLYTVTYLDLHGKTHFVKLLDGLQKSVLQLTVDKFDSKCIVYFKNKYFELDSQNYLTLPSLFYFTAYKDLFKISQTDDSLNNESNHMVSNKNFDVQMECKPFDNIPLANTGLSKLSEDKNIVVKFQTKISVLKACALIKNNHVSQISSAEKRSKEVFTFKATATKEPSVFTFGAKKEIATKKVPQSEIQTYLNKEIKDYGDFNSSLLDVPLGKNVPFEKNASNIVNVVHQNKVPATIQSTDNICTIVREGNVLLFKYFKCPLDFRLVCVIFHALHKAKRPFLLLPQAEQIALVEKILAFEVEDDSCNSLKISSSATFVLNKEQRVLLFISYVVGQSGKLHFSTLIKMFEKHKMDVSVLMESDDYFLPRSPFFSLDNDRCITLENFPPAKWMTERLSFAPLVSPDLSRLSISQSKFPLIANNEASFFGNLPDGHSEVSKAVPTNIQAIGKGVRLNNVKDQTKEMKMGNVSKYPQDTLNVLSDRMYDGVSYLLRFFELNIYFDLQYIFDILLHIAQQCSIFLKLPPAQQEEVIIASFCALCIDEQGRITSAVAKNNIGQLTKVVKMSLCMSFIVRQKGLMHYREIFKYYHKCVGRTKIMRDKDQLEYFKGKKNIYIVCDRGYVSIVKIPTIELDYVSILMSRRFNSLNNIEACVKNTGISDCDYITAVQNNIVPFDEDKCKQSSEDIVAEAVCPDKPENICSVQISNVETEASEEMNSLEKEMTERVIDCILYLSHCFVMVEKVDLLDMILCVLEDVKTYFSNLTLKNRDYFIEKCFFHNYFLHSKDFKFIFCTEVLSHSCTLNDTEKILLFIAYLLSREKALHYTKIFDKFPQYNAAVPTIVRSVLKQYKFISKWKNLFSMNSDGIVRLLRTSTKSKVTLDNNETVFSMSNIPTSDVNDDSKDETKDHIKQLLEEGYATNQNNKTLIESTHGEPALQFYIRIKESVTYLGMTFESVSQEQVMRTLFYVLHDILNLFIDESDFHKNTMKEMLSLFRKRKNTFLPMSKSTAELAHLTEVEKDILALIYIMIHSGPMHYLELFKRFESRGRKVKSMSSRHQYLYIKEKTKYFVIDLKGDVSLNENHICRNLKLDGFFKDMNLKASFHSAIFEASCNNAPTHTQTHRRKFKSFSGCIRQDALYGIYEICSDILSCSKKTPFITKHSCGETDTRKLNSPSEFIEDISTKNPVNEGATWLDAAKPDLTPNETFLHLKGIKPTNVALTSSSLKENPIIQTNEILPSLDRFNSNWRESAMVPGFSETNNTTATNHCIFTQDTWFHGMNPLSSSDSFETIPLYGKNEPGDISIQTKQSQVYQTITDLNSAQSRTHFCENGEDDPSSNKPRKSFLASAYVDQNSTVSSENDNKAVVNRTVATFNLLELQSDDELFSASTKTADSNAKRIDPDCNCSIDSTKELRTMNFFIIILGQSRIGFSVPTLTKKLCLASKEVQHYISCVYNGKILKFVQNNETFYVSHISGNVCLKK